MLVILKMQWHLLLRFLQPQLNLFLSLCMEAVNLQLYEIIAPNSELSVETLRCKPEAYGFDSHCCHWDFSLT